MGGFEVDDLAWERALPLKALEAVDRFVPPPFETWYGLFLGDARARTALGTPLVRRVEAVLRGQAEAIEAIRRMPSVPIHGDFWPANMLVDRRGQVWVVDWEGFGPGHALGDVGQFFRFRRQFGAAALARFEAAYSAGAPQRLPEGWQRLSRLRDLVNPLQLPGRAVDAPRMTADLRAVVAETVAFFEAG